MNRTLAELIKISQRVGKDPDLTQGSSGNTSVKTPDGRFMFVKASGTALADMSAKKGWCKVTLQKIRVIIQDKKLAKLQAQKREEEIGRRLLGACEGIKRNCQPSIETNLHAFLDKCVIHLHPIAIGAFIGSKKGKTELEKLFAGGKYPPLWVSYANPGFALARKLLVLAGKYRKKYGRLPQILFLEKHGLVVSASSGKKAVQLVRKVVNRCRRNSVKIITGLFEET
jgi:rhamnose utilization protein RhaD (predicted bifunctional aldolase and dehydrogenase)